MPVARERQDDEDAAVGGVHPPELPALLKRDDHPVAGQDQRAEEVPRPGTPLAQPLPDQPAPPISASPARMNSARTRATSCIAPLIPRRRPPSRSRAGCTQQLGRDVGAQRRPHPTILPERARAGGVRDPPQEALTGARRQRSGGAVGRAEDHPVVRHPPDAHTAMLSPEAIARSRTVHAPQPGAPAAGQDPRAHGLSF